MKTIYICEGCEQKFDTAKAALACENREKPKVAFKVGDIVTVGKTFGWFDGDPEWIVNKRLLGHARAEAYDKSKCRHPGTNCFDTCCCYQFYYVVTAIDMDGHRTRYHLRTKAMTGKQGYKGGWTYDVHHYTPKRVTRNIPEAVKLAATKMRGKMETLL